MPEGTSLGSFLRFGATGLGFLSTGAAGSCLGTVCLGSLGFLGVSKRLSLILRSKALILYLSCSYIPGHISALGLCIRASDYIFRIRRSNHRKPSKMATGHMSGSNKPLKKRLLADLRNQGSVQTSRDLSDTKIEGSRGQGMMGKSVSFNSLGIARGEREKWGYMEKDEKFGSGCETIDSPRSLACLKQVSKSHPPSPRCSVPELPPLRPITGSHTHLPPHHSPKKPSPSPPLSSFLTQSKPQRDKAERLERKHALSVLQGLRLGRSLPAVDQGTLIMKRVSLGRKPGCSGRKTLIFDLDETLIHCCSDISQADVKLPIILPSQQVTTVGIQIRPYVHECLAAASRLFEVVVFTASQRVYADTVLDYLDPTHSLIHHRLYRENCIPVKGMYVKDLRLFAGRELKDLVIVDNTVISFINQLDNGIPIPTWTNDSSDNELLHLISFFPALLQAADVRTVLSSTFHLREILSDLESYQCN